MLQAQNWASTAQLFPQTQAIELHVLEHLPNFTRTEYFTICHKEQRLLTAGVTLNEELWDAAAPQEGPCALILIFQSCRLNGSVLPLAVRSLQVVFLLFITFHDHWLSL